MTRTLLVVAGEASGDLHGAAILRELRARQPDLRILGIGGEGMSPFLDRKLADVKDLGVVGVVEVLRHLPGLRRLFNELLQVARDERVDAALFLDYPGFNLRLARALRKNRPRPRLFQYVCPQVWAWKKGRIPAIGATLDVLYCLFDFEPRLFGKYPVEAVWVGHPLVESVKPELERADFLGHAGLDPGRRIVALLPGSRAGEIRRLMPPLAGLVRAWEGNSGKERLQWVLPLAPTVEDASVQPFLGELPVRLLRGLTYSALAYADAGIVASGTATLEATLLGLPFALVYRLSPLTYLLGRMLVKIPYVGLANILAGRGVVSELIQGRVRPELLSAHLEHLLEPETNARLRGELGALRSRLGEPGAAARVAEHLLASLEKGS